MKKLIIVLTSFFFLFTSANAIKVYDTNEIGSALRFQFSKDFKSMIYVTKTSSGTYAIYKDDKKLGEYSDWLWRMGDDLGLEPPFLTGEFAISADGTRYAYGVYKGDGKYVIIENGKESEEYDRISYMSYDNLGGIDLQDKLGYYASNNLNTSTHDYRENYIIIDGKKDFTKPSSYSDLIVSPDGTKSVYIDYKCGVNGSCVVENGVKGNAYLNISNRMRYTPDSKYLLYIAQKDNGNYVTVINGVEGKESTDEIRWTDRNWGVGPGTYYMKNDDGTHSINELFNELYNFTVPLGYNNVSSVRLSPDKTRYVFMASKGTYSNSDIRSVVVENGKIITKEIKGVYSLFYYSPDSKKLSFIVDNGSNYTLFENGVEFVTGNFPDPGIYKYTPDSKYLIYNYVNPNKVGYFQELRLNDRLLLRSEKEEHFSDLLIVDDNHFILSYEKAGEGYRNFYLKRISIEDKDLSTVSTTIEKTYQNIKKEFDERYGDKYINNLERALTKKTKEELENLYVDFNSNYIEKKSYERLELAINYINAGILYYISLK